MHVREQEKPLRTIRSVVKVQRVSLPPQVFGSLHEVISSKLVLLLVHVQHQTITHPVSVGDLGLGQLSQGVVDMSVHLAYHLNQN